MLTVGDRLPDFRLRALAGPGAGSDVTPDAFPGRWLLLVYWPLDFALVCASEIEELHRRHPDLLAHGAQAVGAGQGLGSLGRDGAAHHDLRFPLLDDGNRELAEALGIGNGEGGALRATFIADPARRIRWVRVSDLSAGRFVPEVLHALVSAKDGGRPTASKARKAARDYAALLRMCAWCKKVKDEAGDWSKVEDYIRRFTGQDFTHGICPDCLVEHS